MKPTLKAPGTKRLEVKYVELLSSFAFNFNLRRYTTAAWLMLTVLVQFAGGLAATFWARPAVTPSCSILRLDGGKRLRVL